MQSFYLFLTQSRLHTILGFVLLGIVSRFIPHPPNFTALNAIALFSICSLGNLRMSLLTVFTTMFLCDIAFGFPPSMSFVYLALGLITLLGYALKNNRSFLRTTIMLTLSSLVFFIVTNFAVWLEGAMYPMTFTGLSLCYLAGLPFLVNNLLSTLFFGGLLFCLTTLSDELLLDLKKSNS